MNDSIVEKIYAIFAGWSSVMHFQCKEGCAFCCTRNVTITALEGQRIIAFSLNQKPAGWLADRLSDLPPVRPAAQTTNEFIKETFANGQSSQPLEHSATPCPFLDDDRCSVYSVRPFSCRCFFSTSHCGDSGSATVPDSHLYGSMAVMQIIEHLGQFEIWGNMTDVLMAILDNSSHHRNSSQSPSGDRMSQSRHNVRLAQPLPGFIIPEKEKEEVNILLRLLFSQKIGNKTIEQILNGQQ